MFSIHRMQRQLTLTALAGGLLVIAVLALASVAGAQPADVPTRSTYHPVFDHGGPYRPAISSDAGQISAGQAAISSDASQIGADSGTTAAERYYSSFGHPKPIPAVASTTSDDGTPWLLISLAAGLPLLLVGAATGPRGWRRMRHRHAVHVPA